MKRYPYLIKSLLVTSLCITVGCSPTPVKEEASSSKSQPGQPVGIKKAAEAIIEITADKESVSADSVGMGYDGDIQNQAAAASPSQAVMLSRKAGAHPLPHPYPEPWIIPPPQLPADFTTESYTPTSENPFINSLNDPLSTFSIDVDTASYANVRRFINQGSMPPVGAVRLEEMINYFSYDYPQPTNGPFSIHGETGPCPWNPDHRLVKLGIQGKKVDETALPYSNLVFLIDVSGSMSHPNKLPLLQKSMSLLVDQMREKDRISIVTYAGSDRVVLPPTSGSEKEKIKEAIAELRSGGSTHGSSGIVTAYELAKQSFMPGGSNRVILASDGDFNVGTTSRGELQKLIEEKRETGIYLTTLGFGMGNYHDDTMEILADKGNGNYGYIDSLLEAKKVLLKERAGTLFSLANDVKIQIEFNPVLVGAYRLLGYENRMLADEDFKDDTKDAGEIGLGHSVTALYEIIPAGSKDIPQVDELKYSKPGSTKNHENELLTLKLRYKPLGQQTSKQLTQTVSHDSPELKNTSDDFRFSASVAGFALLLKDSEYKGKLDYPTLIELAKGAKGKDSEGYRAEFIRLVENAELIAPKTLK